MSGICTSGTSNSNIIRGQDIYYIGMLLASPAQEMLLLATRQRYATGTGLTFKPGLVRHIARKGLEEMGSHRHTLPGLASDHTPHRRLDLDRGSGVVDHGLDWVGFLEGEGGC